MENSKSKNIASYVIQGLIGIMFLMGSVGNLLESEMAIEQAAIIGMPEESVFCLGLILLISTILYLIPKTNVLGAGFLTAWLGGAVAIHIANGDPVFNQIMPVIFGIIVWVGIWLRNEKLRSIFPIN